MDRYSIARGLEPPPPPNPYPVTMVPHGYDVQFRVKEIPESGEQIAVNIHAGTLSDPAMAHYMTAVLSSALAHGAEGYTSAHCTFTSSYLSPDSYEFRVEFIRPRQVVPDQQAPGAYLSRDEVLRPLMGGNPYRPTV